MEMLLPSGRIQDPNTAVVLKSKARLAGSFTKALPKIALTSIGGESWFKSVRSITPDPKTTECSLSLPVFIPECDLNPLEDLVNDEEPKSSLSPKRMIITAINIFTKGKLILKPLNIIEAPIRIKSTPQNRFPKKMFIFTVVSFYVI